MRALLLSALLPIIEGHPACTPEGIHFSGKV